MNINRWMGGVNQTVDGAIAMSRRQRRRGFRAFAFAIAIMQKGLAIHENAAICDRAGISGNAKFCNENEDLR